MRPPSATSALFPYTTLFRSYNSGDLIAIKSFMAVSVVGLGRNGGAIIGALLVTGTEGYVGRYWRSEEHTSELQSHVKLVCRLLLEKKKALFQGRTPTFFALW